MSNPAEFFSPLLYESEGTTLDFKRDQYKFVGAVDREKGEILKDILAFTNACWRADGYILIGVDEGKESPKALVVGIAEHLSDADLQQFVNSKTNAPVEFSYSKIELEGKSIGVIHVPVQQRPRYLKKAYGDLIANAVYVRRGSSTAIATPEEIIHMGALQTPFPQLDLQLADRESRQLLGTERVIESTLLDTGEINHLPDYPFPKHPAFNMGLPASMLEMNKNPDYYRQLAAYGFQQSLCKPIQLGVLNSGTAMATDIRIELSISARSGLYMLDESDLLAKPTKQRPFYSGMDMMSRHLATENVNVRLIDDRWLIEASVQKVQPKSRAWVWSDLYVGSAESQRIVLEGQITADNIPRPQAARLVLNFETTIREITIQELEELYGDSQK